jgi:hypothetical protein
MRVSSLHDLQGASLLRKSDARWRHALKFLDTTVSAMSVLISRNKSNSHGIQKYEETPKNLVRYSYCVNCFYRGAKKNIPK